MENYSDIIRAVAQKHRIAPEAIVGHARYRSISWPRQEVCYLLRKAGVSINTAARILNKDRTSIRYGARKHAERLACVKAGAL